MPESIIERQQPKYGQGSIRGLTNTEKRKLRRQNIKDAGKGGLASIYNALTDLPSRVARVPAAGVDQIAGTDIQGAIEKLQSTPSQALRDSASNTKAFDKGSKVADAGIMAAALLGAGRIGGSNVKANTSRAKANKLKNSNRSKAERTLLKKTERDAAKAEEDIKNKTLEEMYNEWKTRENEVREAAEDAYNEKLRNEGRR